MYKKFLIFFLAFMVTGMIFISCSEDSTSPSVDRVITITSPNGGELLAKGETITITWTDNISGDVKIELFDGAEGYEIESATESDGEYDFTVPGVLVEGPYVIKITSVDNSAIYDFSDSEFVVTPTATTDFLIVTSPNGGETWEMNTTQTITWMDNLSDTDVAIGLYNNGVFYRDIAVTTENDGSYDYAIPTDITEDDDYKVMVIGLTSNTLDFSNNDFEIRSEGDFISVLSPNGGEEWEMGTTEIIFWNDNIDENVKIELVNGLISTVIASSTPSDGSFDFEIPTNLEESSNYEIKITSVSDIAITDTSEDYFTIDPVPSYIRVISPNGGETFQAGTTQTIRWEDNIEENVYVNIYNDGNFIDSHYTESDGSDEITIPIYAEGSDKYSIRIQSASDYDIFDWSDGEFTIVAAPPFIEVYYPNGGENLVIGETYYIYWQDNINGNVKIEFFENGTLIPEGTIDNAGSDGYYQLEIPLDAELMDGLTMKISSIGDPSVFDWSDGEFSIVSNEPYDVTNISSIPHTGSYSIDATGEIDWYRVYLDSGKGYSFENTSTENFDSAFGLYFYDGEYYVQVAYNDDGGESLQPLINFDVTTSGYYFLKVGYYPNVKQVKKEKQGDYGTGPYTLTIDEIPYGK